MANFVPIRITRVMSKGVISRPAKLDTRGVIKVWVAQDPYSVQQSSIGPIVSQGGPGRGWSYDPRVERALY